MTLLELLVGMTIGLFVIVSALGTLLIAQKSRSTIGDVALLQQQASYALRLIGQTIRQTGSSDPSDEDQDGLFAFNDGAATISGMSTAIHGNDGADTADELTVAMNAARLDLKTSTDWQRDCLGDDPKTILVESRFKVSGPHLLCQTPLNSQPLISNLHDFQVRYRVANATGVQVMNATTVESSSQWQNVQAIEVCLDMMGDEVYADLGATYTNCEGTAVPRGGRLHLVYRNVFNVRATRS